MMTFHEIRDHVHSICETVDSEYDLDTVDVSDAIRESCHEYWPMWTDVWAAAAGLRFEYYDTWFEVDEAYEGPIDNLEAHLFNMVHVCLVLLVEDAYSNGDHLPEDAE